MGVQNPPRVAAPSSGDLRRACAEPYSAWLDAAAPDGWSGGSLLATEPSLIMRARRGVVELSGRGTTTTCTADPFDVLRELLAERRGRPGAAAGYLAYELKRHVEHLPETASDDLALPDCYGCFYDDVLRFEAQLPTSRGAGFQPAFPASLASTFTPEAYRAAVARVLGHIVAGDVYQVNLSQRFGVPVAGHAFSAYERLRAVNPAAFGAYLNFPELQVLSASPELFLRLDAATRRIETRPIKGTRPRGRTPAEDTLMRDKLLASAKDRAENVMIVDLERNDLGRVAEIGSVRVTELAALQELPAVHHLVSTVEATLRPDRDAIDLLRATFPGGSITGAPKIRAMRIIDAVEPVTRGVYTGAIGRFGYDGSLDLNIAIRTAVVAGGTAYVHAGGGIVADSDPEAEYQETLDKARAIIGALATADE
ncbi:MAG: aminodeoxychorismate synthase component I [Dehalococcoidia bacterium]|nr:MAG: aminodeoxychorismate synthase component I [Dehalococcoidia bacterium]